MSTSGQLRSVGVRPPHRDHLVATGLLRPAHGTIRPPVQRPHISTVFAILGDAGTERRAERGSLPTGKRLQAKLFQDLGQPLGDEVRAARKGDIADIIVLARLVGATSAEEAGHTAADIFEGEPLSERSLAVLADLDDALRGS